MKKISKLFFTVLVLCSFFTINSYSQMMNTVTVTGTVYAASDLTNDTTSTPVANAVVTLHSFIMVGGFMPMPSDSIVYQATTDASGKFVIPGVLPGQYELMASATGYATFALRNFVVGSKKDTVSINLFLRDSTAVKGGLVSGKVELNSSHRGIVRAIIEFINASQNHPNIYACTDFDGDFMAKVPAGQYYISCTVITSGSFLFFQEYYDNVTSIADAKIVTVAAGQTITGIDFNLPEHVSEKHNVTFQGNVQSASSMPLSGATIKIWASNEHDWDDQRLIAVTKTDTNGNYSVTLDSIAQSKNTFVVSAHEAGYKLQFYNGQNTFYQANKLFAFSDTTFTGVNFTLTQIDTSTAKYTLSGTVADSANVGINGAFVVLFDSTNGHVHSAITDSLGNYSVNGLAGGSYYALFFAHGYVPQFYLNADKWENATVLHLSSDLTGINVTLAKLDSLTASGEFAGTIHSENGLALGGVLITVKNSLGLTIAATITDADGSYNISGLDEGSYTITASVAQYGSQQQTASYNPSLGTTTVNDFSLTATSVTGVSSETNNLPSKFLLQNNYPNPFNPSTIISFTLPINSRVRLEIYNILGQKVADLINKQMNAGSYNITFNASNLSSGVYLYRLQTDHFTATKKMILAK